MLTAFINYSLEQLLMQLQAKIIGPTDDIVLLLVIENRRQNDNSVHAIAKWHHIAQRTVFATSLIVAVCQVWIRCVNWEFGNERTSIVILMRNIRINSTSFRTRTVRNNTLQYIVIVSRRAAITWGSGSEPLSGFCHSVQCTRDKLRCVGLFVALYSYLNLPGLCRPTLIDCT